jgi:23S rRNA (uracil1939-C5)-methyltransferase
MVNKNDRLVLTCVDYTSEGLGVVKVEQFPIFVKNLMVNEKAEIIVTLVKKSYAFGHLAKLLVASEHRITPPCPIAKVCGGCQLQHLDYNEQLRFKHHMVESVMTRIGKLDVKVQPVMGMDQPFNYRNKVQIPVGIDHHGKMTCGFYRINSNDIVDMESCAIQSDLSNQVYKTTKLLLAQYQLYHDVRHILIKHAFTTDQVMVVLISRVAKLRNSDALVKQLMAKHPQITSVQLNVNQRNDNVILGDTTYLLAGAPTITDRLMDLQFKISAQSFYQVNPVQCAKLYSKGIELAQLTKAMTVLDLYCGIGTITLVAAKSAGKVIGVEVEPTAVADAKSNAKLNNIDNVEFMIGDAGEVAQRLVDNKTRIDVVFVDPPRKGLDDNSKQAIVAMQPDKLIYISCDPGTLARDLAYFKEQGYHTHEVQPVDMFPQTKHVECVVCLKRKDSENSD